MTQNQKHRALLIVSYGGPEQREDVIPFIENIFAGRNIPRERIEQAAQKYYVFDGISPINEECRRLIASLLQRANSDTGPVMKEVNELPIYWGNLFWHPMLEQTVTAMAEDGIREIIAFCTTPFGSPQSFFSYTSRIQSAVEKTGIADLHARTTRLFFNHPLFVEVIADRITEALAMFVDGKSQMLHFNNDTDVFAKISFPETIKILFSAHNLPLKDDVNETYRRQIQETVRLVDMTLDLTGRKIAWEIVFQSRGGGQKENWLGPEVTEFKIKEEKTLVVCPIGFMLENVELLYDLDHDVAAKCHSLDLHYLRTETVGYAPKVVEMIRELVAESLSPLFPRRTVGNIGICPEEQAGLGYLNRYK